MVTAACLFLVASFQIPHILRSRYGVPPAPARQYYRPGVPYEAFCYTKQTVAVQQSDSSADTPGPGEKNEIPPRMIRLGKVALASLNRPANSQGSRSNQSASLVHLNPSPTPND